MNSKDVIISIKGSQHFQGSEADLIELVTAGKYSWEKDKCIFTYQENAGSGLPFTRTTFRIDNGSRVTLTREGYVNSQMLFEEGKKHFSLYETAEGAIMIGVGVHKVAFDLGERGGNLEVDYSVEIDHALAGENRFLINIREPGGATSYTTKLS